MEEPCEVLVLRPEEETPLAASWEDVRKGKKHFFKTPRPDADDQFLHYWRKKDATAGAGESINETWGDLPGLTGDPVCGPIWVAVTNAETVPKKLDELEPITPEGYLLVMEELLKTESPPEDEEEDADGDAAGGGPEEDADAEAPIDYPAELLPDIDAAAAPDDPDAAAAAGADDDDARTAITTASRRSSATGGGSGRISRRKKKGPAGASTALQPDDPPDASQPPRLALLEEGADPEEEQSFFADTVRRAIIRGVFPSWDDEEFKRLWNFRVRSFGRRELDPAIWGPIIEARRAREALPPKDEEKDAVARRYCKSCDAETGHNESLLQLRSGDEGSSLLTTCLRCGHTERFD